MFKSSKKGVVELLGFVLITLLVVISSISAYVFAKSFIDEKVGSYDRDAMEKILVKINQKINQIQVFDQSKSSIIIEFKTGSLNLKNNQISYQSISDANFENFCIDSICYENNNGFEKFYYNLSSLTFGNNVTLGPGNYLLSLKYQKNESKIYTSIQ